MKEVQIWDVQGKQVLQSFPPGVQVSQIFATLRASSLLPTISGQQEYAELVSPSGVTYGWSEQIESAGQFKLSLINKDVRMEWKRVPAAIQRMNQFINQLQQIYRKKKKQNHTPNDTLVATADSTVPDPVAGAGTSTDSDSNLDGSDSASASVIGPLFLCSHWRHIQALCDTILTTDPLVPCKLAIVYRQENMRVPHTVALGIDFFKQPGNQNQIKWTMALYHVDSCGHPLYVDEYQRLVGEMHQFAARNSKSKSDPDTGSAVDWRVYSLGHLVYPDDPEAREQKWMELKRQRSSSGCSLIALWGRVWQILNF